MSGDSDFFDAIIALSVGAARDVAPAWGLSGERAEELGKKIGLRLGANFYHRFAGAQVYISGRSLCRNKLLMAAFTGNNHNELARIFHISTRTVYDIIRTESSKKPEEQLPLPGMEQHGTTKKRLVKASNSSVSAESPATSSAQSIALTMPNVRKLKTASNT